MQRFDQEIENGSGNADCHLLIIFIGGGGESGIASALHDKNFPCSDLCLHPVEQEGGGSFHDELQRDADVPVMPHQAEDIWMNMPDCQKGGLESVLLTDWPANHPEWHNEKLEQDFTKILKAREVVSRAIEPLRADKKVGSALEVSVYVNVKDNEILKANEKDLADIFIVSQAYITDKKPENVMNEYREDDYVVWVAAAEGEKCARCWKYRTLDQEGICKDCSDAIKQV